MGKALFNIELERFYEKLFFLKKLRRRKHIFFSTTMKHIFFSRPSLIRNADSSAFLDHLLTIGNQTQVLDQRFLLLWVSEWKPSLFEIFSTPSLPSPPLPSPSIGGMGKAEPRGGSIRSRICQNPSKSFSNICRKRKGRRRRRGGGASIMGEGRRRSRRSLWNCRNWFLVSFPSQTLTKKSITSENLSVFVAKEFPVRHLFFRAKLTTPAHRVGAWRVCSGQPHLPLPPPLPFLHFPGIKRHVISVSSHRQLPEIMIFSKKKLFCRNFLQISTPCNSLFRRAFLFKNVSSELQNLFLWESHSFFRKSENCDENTQSPKSIRIASRSWLAPETTESKWELIARKSGRSRSSKATGDRKFAIFFLFLSLLMFLWCFCRAEQHLGALTFSARCWTIVQRW